MPQLSQASAVRHVNGSSLAESAQQRDAAHDRRDESGAEEVLAHAPRYPGDPRSSGVRRGGC